MQDVKNEKCTIVDKIRVQLVFNLKNKDITYCDSLAETITNKESART